MHQRSISGLLSPGQSEAPAQQLEPSEPSFGSGTIPRPVAVSSGEAIATSDGLTFYASANDSSVVKEFHDDLMRNPDMAVAVAAIKALTSVMKKSTATTMMGLEKELREASASLKKCNPTAISLQAGSELFLRFVTRTAAQTSEDEHFDACKAQLIQRGNLFAKTSAQARQTIAALGAAFIRSGATVLIHGMSRVVLTLLQHAAQQGCQFSAVVTEGRPDGTGIAMARQLEKLGVPVTIVLDSGVAYTMDRIDMVLIGAEGVVESGGIINKLGTYQISLCAKAFNVPVYVAAESYKFARLYPLSQRDVPVDPKHVDFGPLLPKVAQVDNPSTDYTPPSCIKLLFTDLGVLTPAAVSDELIQLYL